MQELSPVAAAKKQAVKFVPPERGYPEFVRFRTPGVRFALSALLCTGMLAFFGSFFWFLHLLRASPDAPVAAAGQVIRMSNHGDIFFVRPMESLIFNALSWGGWVIAVLAGVTLGAVFGQDAARPSLAGRAQGIALIVIVVLTGAAVLTAGRFPFDLAALG